MSLDPNKPTDQELVSMLPWWIRQLVASINAIETEGHVDIVFTELTVSPGVTALVIGTDLSDATKEYIKINSLGVALIGQIRGGTEGQIKTFIFQGNNLSFLDGPKLTGQLYLNQLPVLSPFNAQQDDVITLINIGGDGAGEYGYWKEISRQLSVK
jgi:hypothetical protein